MLKGSLRNHKANTKRDILETFTQEVEFFFFFFLGKQRGNLNTI